MKADGVFQDWKATPYDWRLSLDQLTSSGVQSGQNISYINQTDTPYIAKTLLELASTSRTKKVTVIAHSNGGLVLKALLMAHPELSQSIDKIIFAAVPHVGTPQSVEALLSARDEAIPFKVRAATTRSLAQNMPMSYNLLPSSQFFSYVDDPVISFDPATMQDWITRYGVSAIHSQDRLRAFLLDQGHDLLPTPNDTDLVTPIHVNSNLFNQSATQHILLDSWEVPLGVQVIEIAGWGKETLSGITYRRDPQNVCVAKSASGECVAIQSLPTKLTFSAQHVIDGDGTVVEPSALWLKQGSTTKYWLNLQKNGQSHPTIFSSVSLLNLVTNLIEGSAKPTPLITTVAPASQSSDRLHFTLHSPLALGYINAEGQYTGSTDTAIRRDIPEVYFEQYGEVQWLSIPKDLSGKLVLRGKGSGSFTLDIEEVRDGKTLSSTAFAGIPSSTSTTASIVIDSTTSPTSNGVLRVDFNGDGKDDRVLVAKLDQVVLPDVVPPEVEISISTSTRDLTVKGIDTDPTVVKKTATATFVADLSGNVTTIYFQKTFAGSTLSYARLTGVNYGTTTIPLPSSFLYVWDSSKTLLSQTVVVDKQFIIEAIYDKKKDRTTIVVLRKNLPSQTAAYSGQRLIKLTTNKGLLMYSW